MTTKPVVMVKIMMLCSRKLDESNSGGSSINMIMTLHSSLIISITCVSVCLC